MGPAGRAGLITVQYLVSLVAQYVIVSFAAETGWQRWVVPIAVTLGVWGVGALAAADRRRFTAGRFAAKLATTAVGAGLVFSGEIAFSPLLMGAAAIIGFSVIPERKSATPPAGPTPAWRSERGLRPAPDPPERPESSVSG